MQTLSAGALTSGGGGGGGGEGEGAGSCFPGHF